MHATMSAAVFGAPGRVELHRVERPDPAPGQVRLRVEGCGVCASNLPLWQGAPWMAYPMSPGEGGHEAWGSIDALGDGVRGLEVGQRVAAISYSAYAQYDLAEAEAVVPLPPALDGRPFPGEPLACAMNILQRSGIAPGQDVAIVGVGFLGAALAQLASGLGARVVAISRRASALSLARELGAEETIRMGDDLGAVADEARALTDDRGFDRVIECAGAQETLDLATWLTGTRARLVIAGYHQDGPRQVDMQVWNWRGLDVINAHERDLDRYVDGVRRAIGAVLEDRLDLERLVTHRFELAGLGEALSATATKPDGMIKAWVQP